MTDQRSKRKKKHNQAEVLTYLIAAYMVGRTSLRRAIAWAKRNEALLRKHLKLEGGIASVSTISRMLSGIDEIEFGMIFLEWISQIVKPKGVHIVIDGKALRAAADKRKKDSKSPYILNVIDATTKLVLTQLPIAEKKNEISTIPRLLDMLDLTDNIITIDAIGTQTEIMNLILSRGGHYVLTVKKNNRTAYDEILGHFRYAENTIEQLTKIPGRKKELEDFRREYDKHSTVEKNRERMEYRTLMTKKCDPTFFTRETEAFMQIKTMGCLTQIRIPIEQDKDGKDITRGLEAFLTMGSERKPKISEGDDITDDIEKVGVISDMEISAEEMLGLHRSHWSIENNLHHVLDDAFREDRSPAKKSKNNLSLIRKTAFNLLTIMATHEILKMGIQDMMDLCCDDHKLLAKYVFKGIPSFY